MAIYFNDNLQIRAPKAIDDRYGPWVDLEEGLSNVPKPYRHIKLTLNVNGTEYWFKEGIEDIDLVIKEYGSNSKLVISVFKRGINGEVDPELFSWGENKTISEVRLLSNCVSISVTISATTYDHNTIVGITLLAGQEMIINDITIAAGHNNANCLIIF